MPIDVKRFLDRVHMKGVELQKKLDLSSGAISQYNAGRAYPSYPVLCGMIEEGMNIYEMFGKELSEKLLENSGIRGGSGVAEPQSENTSTDDNSLFNSEAFKQGVLKVLSEQQILEFKMGQSLNKLMGEIKK